MWPPERWWSSYLLCRSVVRSAGRRASASWPGFDLPQNGGVSGTTLEPRVPARPALFETRSRILTPGGRRAVLHSKKRPPPVVCQVSWIR